jgi:GNAT superfamily N-acetyltransferase
VTLSGDYVLVAGPPSLEDYLRLRRTTGLTPRTEAQAQGALSGSWLFCHVRHRPSSDTVAMGRVIGDGGWYFHVADMATSPEHQRQGIGRAVLDWLLDGIRARAPAGAYVSLVADPPGRPLYEKAGFQVVADGWGMELVQPG